MPAKANKSHLDACGTLYVVATPIGNLKDITLRAIEVLKLVDVIASEDTRHTKNLLNHFSIDTPMTSCFEHNEKEKSLKIISMLSDGQNVALVSEAGTPAISDPGYRLIKAAHENDITVRPIPGASAALAAMSVSGLPTDRFLFVGFLPDKKGKRQTKLKEIEDETATLVFYISKWKVMKVLQDIFEILGNRNVCYCREITKLHEEIKQIPLEALIEELQDKTIKGEITLIVSGKTSAH